MPSPSMLFIIKSGLFSISLLFFLACSSGHPQDDDDLESTESVNAASDSQKVSAQQVFNTIPGRQTILSLVQQSSAEYNFTFLNNPDDLNKYTLESCKALNLGAYGADLIVTGVFEQTQESMLFMKCVSTLAKGLGISNAFDEKMIDRIEHNKQNRDSTLEIISQSFQHASAHLKANGRPGTSSLIVAGAWVEGFYIACHTAKETQHEGSIQEIIEQKKSLGFLVELLESSNVSEDATYLVSDLKSLKKIIDAKNTSSLRVDDLKDLDEKITEIRTKIITTT